MQQLAELMQLCPSVLHSLSESWVAGMEADLLAKNSNGIVAQLCDCHREITNFMSIV